MTAAVDHRIEALDSGSVLHRWTPPGRVDAVVQLQHGFAEYSERYLTEYRRLIPRLLDAGIAVGAMDLPGHGDSPGRRAVTDLRRAVHDHREARRRLATPGLPLLLFGHSLGGLVTAASVGADPDGVRRVVLTSPVILRRTPAPLRVLARGLAAIAPAAQLPGRPALMARDPEVGRRAALDERMFHGTTTLSVAASALDVADRLWADLDRWRTPTTVFHGTRDEATSHERSAAFVARIGRPDVVLRTVRGGFHELLHDVPGSDTIVGEVLALLAPV